MRSPGKRTPKYVEESTTQPKAVIAAKLEFEATLV
jgi:hypothetical protein